MYKTKNYKHVLEIFKCTTFIKMFLLTAFFDAELVVMICRVPGSVGQLQVTLMQSPLTVISLATEKL